MKFIFRNVLGLSLLLSSSLFFHAHAMAEPGICIRLRQQLKLPVREEPQTSRAVQTQEQPFALRDARMRALDGADPMEWSSARFCLSSPFIKLSIFR